MEIDEEREREREREIQTILHYMLLSIPDSTSELQWRKIFEKSDWKKREKCHRCDDSTIMKYPTWWNMIGLE